jgi:hypothetical protein
MDIGRRRIAARTNRYQGDAVLRVANSKPGITDFSRAVAASKRHVGAFIHAIADSKHRVPDSKLHVEEFTQAIAPFDGIKSRTRRFLCATSSMQSPIRRMKSWIRCVMFPT